MREIVPPKNCPSCGSTLEWKKDILYCINATCPAQIYKAVENHLKVLKIKGLGPQLLKKLELSHLFEIYDIDLEEITELLGSEKIAKKVFDQITNIRKSQVELRDFLASLSIPSVGLSTAEKIAKACETLEDVCERLENAKLGPKTHDKVLLWLEENEIVDVELPFSLKNSLFGENDENKEAVCITGRLKGLTKAKAKQQLENAGYNVVNTVSNKTDYLLCEGAQTSAKAKKALKLNIPIITSINELLSKREDSNGTTKMD